MIDCTKMFRIVKLLLTCHISTTGRQLTGNRHEKGKNDECKHCSFNYVFHVLFFSKERKHRSRPKDLTSPIEENPDELQYHCYTSGRTLFQKESEDAASHLN